MKRRAAYECMDDQSDPSPPASPSPPPPRRFWIWLAGMGAGSAVGGVLSALLAALGKSLAASVILPSIALLPILIGLVAAFVWRSLKPTIGNVALQTLLLTLLDVAGAMLIWHEGSVCLIMGAPLLYVCILTGGLLGRVLFKQDPSHLRMTVLPLFALVALAEPLTRSDQTAVVTDEILIHATPARVWPQITSFPAIPEPPRFWLFKIGLPYPVATTTSGNFVGADRRCIFSGNAVFKESVANLVPNRELTFDIDEVPADPELLGHLAPQRGQFLLRDNQDGTTTLIGSTWYSLKVRPLWYFNWWTQSVFRAVHLRVMEDVKRRAEAAS